MTAPPAPVVDWSELAGRVRHPSGLFVDGSWLDAVGGDRLEVVSPVDGRVVAEIACGDERDIDLAVAAARRSFEDGRWSRLLPRERKEVLVRWSQLCAEHADELAVLHTLEMGKPAREARDVDVRAVVRTLQWFGEASDKLVDEIPHTGADSLALVTREPAGVVGAVVPWNFPLTMAAWKLAPAWTNDLNRAHRVSQALKVGAVWVNYYEEGDLTVPFGGVKQSGFGRDKSLHALDKFLDLKTTWLQLS